MLRWIGKAILWVITKISRAVTFVVLLFGALTGIHTINGEVDASRAIIALYVFFIGLIIGVLIFGKGMSIIAWLVVVVVILFLMNMKNAWLVAAGLIYGHGLDYADAASEAGALASVTPSEEAVEELHHARMRVAERVHRNVSCGTVTPVEIDFTGEESPKQLIEGEDDG